MDEKKEFDFFDRPKVIRGLWISLYVVCGLLIIPDFFMRGEPHFRVDGLFGFYALLGFVSCSVLILFSKLVGFLLKKREDYYDE
jgi:hypothetical protein